MNTYSFIACGFAALCCSMGRADHLEPRPLSFSFDASCSEASSCEPRHGEYSLAAVQPARFGAAGSVRWGLHGGYGFDVKTSRNRVALGGVGFSFFIIDNLSLDLEANILYFDQVGRDAVGGNFNLLFRWHFLARETWSIYADAGAGILFTTRDVPSNSSSFNFTPQAGFGFSFDIGNEMRLLTGLRWHHVSNANLYRSNPGRDHVLGYVGVSMPF